MPSLLTGQLCGPEGAPMPSWPPSLSPQHQSSPESLTAQAVANPTEIPTAVGSPFTTTGNVLQGMEIPSLRRTSLHPKG